MVQHLTDRLLKIASLVPKNTYLADIGTDHAHLPIYLIENGITNSCIAADIVDGPLEMARKNISAHGFEDKIRVVKSNGLDKVYPFTPETVVIAGMGGETIRDIISACDFSKDGAPLFILQPMTHTELLREYLIKNGFSILNEDVVREAHRFYVIMVVKYLEKQEFYFDAGLGEIYEIGGILADTEDKRDYLIWRREICQRNAASLSKSIGATEKIQAINNLISEIDRRLSDGKIK